jgi:hypothetical protein
MSKLGPNKGQISKRQDQTTLLVSANKNIVYKNARKPKSELKYNELFFSKICDDFFPKKTRENATIKNIFFPTFVQNSAHKIKADVCLQVTSIEEVICVQMSQCFYKSRCPTRKFHLN